MGQLKGQLDALVAEKCCSSAELNGWAFICTFTKKKTTTYKTNNLQGDWETNKQLPRGFPLPLVPPPCYF